MGHFIINVTVTLGLYRDGPTCCTTGETDLTLAISYCRAAPYGTKSWESGSLDSDLNSAIILA